MDMTQSIRSHKRMFVQSRMDVVTGRFHYGRRLYSDVAKLFAFMFCHLVTGRKHCSRGHWHWTLVLQIDIYTRGRPTDITITLARIVQMSETRTFIVDVSTLVDVSNLVYQLY